MRVFICDDHDYHWPVGVASVAIADDEVQARALLDAELMKHGLRPNDKKPYTVKEIVGPTAVVICDGEY